MIVASRLVKSSGKMHFGHMTDNVDLVHIWTGTCQNVAIPAVNDDIPTVYIRCNSSNKFLFKITFRLPGLSLCL